MFLLFPMSSGLACFLQTGDEYRDRIGLDNSELAVLIGSKAITELHSQAEHNDDFLKERSLDSESLERLLIEDVDYDCDIPEEGLATVLKQQRDRKFLYAPVLVCTIDHIMAATFHMLPFLACVI